MRLVQAYLSLITTQTEKRLRAPCWVSGGAGGEQWWAGRAQRPLRRRALPGTSQTRYWSETLEGQPAEFIKQINVAV